MSRSEKLEDRLKAKLESGEISKEEYDELYNKFLKLGILDKDQPDTQDAHNIYATGTKTIEGGKYGSVVSSGKLIVDGPIECRRLSISGAADIDGNLSVIETSIISGDLEVKGVAKFGGSVSSTGSIQVGGDIYTASKLNSSGNLIVEGSIITDKKIVIEGELQSQRLLSSSNVSMSGKIQVGDIVAETLELESGRMSITGNIQAKKVKIMEPFVSLDLNSDQLLGELNDIPPFVRDLTQTLTNNFLPKVEKFVNTMASIFDPIKGFVEVDGNVTADIIILANVHIRGDVIGKTITLGQNVKVDGEILYQDEINPREYEGLRIRKIGL